MKGFAGSKANPTIVGNLGNLHNVLGCASATTTLVSVGACVEGTASCISFYEDAAFKVSGIRIWKDNAGNIQCRIGKNINIEHFADRRGPTGIYKIPGGISYFSSKNRKRTTFANLAAYVKSSKDTDRDIWKFSGQHSVCNKCHMPTSRTSAAHDLMYAAMDLPDFIVAHKFTVDQLTASQHKHALTLLRMHNAMGHISKRHLRWILQQSPNKSERELAKYVELQPLCNHCLIGKSHYKGNNKQSPGEPEVPTKFLSDLSADNSGPQNVATTSGYSYFMVIVCKNTSFTWIRLLKSLIDTAPTFEKFLRVARQHIKKPIKRFRADHGPADFGNLTFSNLLQKYDIQREPTGGSSTHNPKAERRIGLIQTDVLTFMSWACAPRVWWGHCAKYAVTTRNLVPIATNAGFKSPYEAAYNRPPDRSMQQPFGCLVFVNVPRISRHGKLNHRGTVRTCALLDYELRPDGHPLAYILFDCDNGEIITRPKQHLTFNPDIPAMQHVARNAKDIPDNKFIGDVIAKYFDNTLFYGKVVSNRIENGELLWHVVYEDGDREDFNMSEVIIHSRMATRQPPNRKVSIPGHRDNATTTSLRQAVNNAANTANTNIGDAVLAHLRRSAARVPPPKHIGSMPSHTREVLGHHSSARSTQSLSRPSRHAPRTLTNVSVTGDITNNLHSSQPMFDVRDTHTRRKLLVALIEHEVSAYGFLVEPPASDVPEIVIPPNTKARLIPIPKNYREAVTGPYRKYWQKTIETEIGNLIRRGVWAEVDMPPHAKVIKGRYVFKVKPDENNNIDKFRARWIVQGFRQRPGLDFDKTFAAVSNIVTIRIIFAVGCELNLEIYTADVVAAYLLGKIEKGIKMYIQTPDGYALHPDFAALLQSGLYGTKQAGKLWADKRTKVLNKLGLETSAADPSLYIRHDGNNFILVATVVDDFLMTGFPKSYLDNFKQQLFAEMEMTGGDDVKWFLNMTITRDRKLGLLKLDQSKYVETVLAKYNMTKCRIASTPTQDGVNLSKLMCPVTDEEKIAARKVPYMSLIGSLLYFRITRPDTLQAISKLAAFSSCHGIAHWKAAKHVLRYIKGTPNHGLLYSRSRKTIKQE